MKLTTEEKAMLAGKRGFPAQKAMEVLVGLGECYDAKRMVPVASVHLLYNVNSMGEGGALFLKDLADQGAKFSVFADTNPCGVARGLWKSFGTTPEFVKQQEDIGNNIIKMGGYLANACTPYLVGHVPRFGQHVAWNESSAVIFANSVLGARTNREGGPSAIASGIAGRTPEYGFHLDAERRGQLEIRVTARLNDLHDYSTLGYFAGKLAEDRIPVLTGIAPGVSLDALKIMGGCMATSGSVAMFHAIGVTPEAPTLAAAYGGRRPRNTPIFEFGEKELKQTEESLNKAKNSKVDIVTIGCPHVSIAELGAVADLLKGKKIKPGVEFWVATVRQIKEYGEDMGYTKVIEAAGGKIVCDTCPSTIAGVVAKGRGPMTAATDSAKMAYYISIYADDILAYYGSVEKCVAAAISGVWR